MTPFDSTKILHYTSHVDAIVHNDWCPPITVELDLTNLCNHCCRDCAGGKHNKSSLTLNESHNYINQLVSSDTRGLIFTGGGEPLVHQYAIDIITYARNTGLHIGLITNGGLLNREKVNALLPICDWIRVSLDAGSPEDFKLTHGMATDEYYKILSNIDLLGECKTRTGSSCTIGVGYLIDHNNRGNFTKLVARLCDSGVDYIQARPFHYRAIDVSDDISMAKKYETANFRIVCSTSKYVNLNIERPYNYCYAAKVCGVIQADANIPICCHMRGLPQFYIGSLHEKSWDEIWYSKHKAEILSRLNVHNCIPLCRGDGINRVIYNLLCPIEHLQFL